MNLLLIETSTNVCSVALYSPGRMVSRETDVPKAHASRLAVLIDEVLKECGLTVGDCSAVAVSKGPGSYTGLRVGVSTAKGLCFGASLPLISVCSLQLLAQLYVDTGSEMPYRIVPMIDARRMEVYTAAFRVEQDHAGGFARPVDEVRAEIITTDSFAGLLEQGPVTFVGNGAEKCSSVITHPNARFINSSSHACGMAKAAQKAWDDKKFEDVAYFTPFYLKEFRAVISQKGV